MTIIMLKSKGADLIKKKLELFGCMHVSRHHDIPILDGCSTN